MFTRRLPDAWWSCGLLIAATYVFATTLLPAALLILINGAGYLPYSDRPGPSWHPPHLPTGDEIQFYLGFVLLLAPGASVYGLCFAVAGVALGFCSLPRWALQLIAAPSAFIASGLMMAAAGWMIAISSTGIYAAAGCGALWGVLVFPKLVPRIGRALPNVVRITLPVVMLAAGSYWLIKSLLPDPGLTNAKIEIIRQSDAGANLSGVDLTFVGPSLAKKVEGSGKYVSVSRMEFTTSGRNQVRVLLIVDDGHAIPNTFPLPRSGDAVYRQSRGVWHQERSEDHSSKVSLQLSSQGSDGISLQLKGPCCSSMTQNSAPYQ
jgi:hypothetical protein